MNTLKWKRIYHPASSSDGDRILVDQLWPRGVSKEKAALSEWAKSITPSKEIRKAYHEGRLDFKSFSERYERELAGSDAFVEFSDDLKTRLKDHEVTLVFAGRVPSQTHLPALKNQLNRQGVKSEALPEE